MSSRNLEKDHLKPSSYPRGDSTSQSASQFASTGHR
ncbi:unnamed protein product, partial [Amoebophrya sp. A25]|eukprot:GSA25T00001479001.1